MSPDPTAMTAAMNAAADKARHDAMVSGMRSAAQASVEKKQADEAAARAAEREVAALERMKRFYGDMAGSVDKARRSAEAMGKSLRDGSLVRATRDMDRFRREEARYRQEAERRARYAPGWGFLAHTEKPLQMLESATRTLMAKTDSLYNRGMQGTVEQGRREMELNLLGREIASIFKPVSDITTEVVKGLRKFLGGLNKSEQNLLLGAGVAATSALSAVAMTRGGGLARAALAGTASAGGLAAGMSLGDVAMAGIGAKSLWGLRGGATAAAEGGGMAASLRAGWATMPEVAAAAKVAPEAAPSFFSRAATRLGGLAASKGFGMGGELFSNAMNIKEGYDRRREEGGSMRGSLFRSMLSNAVDKAGENYVGYGTWKSMTDIFSSVTGGGKKAGADAAKERDDEMKRRVLMQGGGFQESGSGYEQLAAAFGKVAEPEEKAKGEGEVVKAITELGKMLAPIIERAKADSPELRRPEGR